MKQNYKKYPKIKKTSMRTRRIEVIKSIIEDKTANQINFGFGRKDGGPVTTETGLYFTEKLNID